MPEKKKIKVKVKKKIKSKEDTCNYINYGYTSIIFSLY